MADNLKLLLTALTAEHIVRMYYYAIATIRQLIALVANFIYGMSRSGVPSPADIAALGRVSFRSSLPSPKVLANQWVLVGPTSKPTYLQFFDYRSPSLDSACIPSNLLSPGSMVQACLVYEYICGACVLCSTIDHIIHAMQSAPGQGPMA